MKENKGNLFFVVGTALTRVAGAAENTITWLKERSGELQETFGKAVGRKSLLFVVEMLTATGTNSVHFWCSGLFGALYLLVGLTGRPKRVLQCKIQDGSSQQPINLKKLLN